MSEGGATGFDGDLISRFLSEPDPAQAIALWIENFAATGTVTGLSTSAWLSRQIALLDELVNEQLNCILHQPKLQQLESGWRGLWRLADTASHYSGVKLKVLNISWREVSKDIDRASDFDQSQLFQLIYSQEFGTAGGEPFGVLLGDYQVSHRPFAGHPYSDIPTLRGLAQIAAAAFAPFICAATPQLFGIDDFETLGQPINFQEVFRQREYIQWRSLRELEDARFLGVCLPRIIMRKPYTAHLVSYGGLLFNEQCEGDSGNYLWGNPCYAFGTVLIREFGEVGWFAHIRGVPRDYYGGGLVTGFPAIDYGLDSPGTATKILTEMVITDNNERQLSELGLMCLCHCYDTEFAAFQSCPSVQKARQFQGKAETANARISAMLQQVFCASRFAHYIKVMIRDKVGSFAGPGDCEQLLQEWFNRYATAREDLKWDMLARYPLRSARVQVRELPGKPGSYTSIIHLKPHYIVDHLVSELKLTTELALSGFGTGH
ncbi:type VI secretion system contractile sheath large subunit [Exilibacterium tricleocarpae]|uniref:Type VI secretion system contractile sheath large subunit n=1 Tax=Exilibacterium tricleocarpae TaxID=2591008 RepID=A0A545SPP5_9GAMM|nr:type VI secretion system contractile sheath large subunit [Exilibacterium tricleocarpae]